MNVDWPSFFAVWGFISLNILSPGPNVLNTITTAMGSGRLAGIWSALAVGIGISLWCLGMSFGVAVVFAILPMAQTAMRLLGAGLLLWFASRYLRSAWRGFRRHPSALHGVAGLTPWRSFMRSLSVNAMNPSTYDLAVRTDDISDQKATGLDVAILCAGTALSGMVIHFAYAILFSTRTAARFYQRTAPIVNAAVGLFFLFVAVELTKAALTGEVPFGTGRAAL